MMRKMRMTGLAGTLAAAALAASLSVVTFAASAPAKPAPAEARAPDHAAMRREWIQHRLDNAAARLEIKASQQSAWKDYSANVLALADMAGTRPMRPAPDADAATIARERAERASDFARKLGTIADATARLQGVLTPEQKAVLTEITRQAGHPHAGHPDMMEHGGLKEHRQHDWHGSMPPDAGSEPAPADGK